MLHENGILENITKKGEVIEVEDIKLLIRTNIALAKKKPYGALIDQEELSVYSKDTLEYSTRKDFSPMIVARALLVKNLSKRIVGNFCIKIIRPFVKTRLFTEKEKAMTWLESQIKEFRFSRSVADVSK